MTLSHSAATLRWLAPLPLAGSTLVAGCATTKSDVQDSTRPSTP